MMSERLAHKAHARRIPLMLTGTTHDQRVQLFAQGLKPPALHYESSLTLGRSKLRHLLDRAPATT